MNDIEAKTANSLENAEKLKKEELQSQEEVLAVLLTEKKLTWDKVIDSASKCGIEVIKLSRGIIGRAKLRDEFKEYLFQIKGGNELTEREKEDIYHSFFEQIRKKTEITPAEIEKEPEVEVVEVLPESQEPEKEPTVKPETPQEAETPEVPKTPEISSPEPIPPAKTAVQPPENLPIEETIETIPNPGRRNWQEVKRETEVMAIEDLSGSMRTFEEHVTRLGVAKKDARGEWKWTGGNKKLVFLGDILGDRAMDGMKITSIIGSLSEQAQKQDGQVDFLCGNHDMEFIGFLCSARSDWYIEKNARTFSDQSIGIWELAKFDPDPNSKLKEIDPIIRSGKDIGAIKKEFEDRSDELWPKLYERMPDILANMIISPEGKNILENLCQIKVAVVHDDTLFCHTDPTIRIIADLVRDGNISQRVVEVNKIFQQNLRIALFEGAKLGDDFNLIEKIYLHTSNREYFVEDKSFDILAIDITERLVKYLYAHRKIEFDQEALDDFQVRGSKAFSLDYMLSYLKRNLINMDMNDEDVLTVIDTWEKDNGLDGDYLQEVNKIFGNIIEIRKAFIGNGNTSNEIEKFFESIDLLKGKIEHLNPQEKNIDRLRDLGVNAIVHGHTSTRRGDNNYYDKNELIIVSPHAYLGKGSDASKGICTIQKNGRIDLIGKTFRK